MVKPKQEQKEFSNLPTPSALAQACLGFLKTKEEIEGMQENLEKQKLPLAELFRASGKKSVKVAGHTFSLAEFNQIKISVRRE